ncbi:MAG TPA: DUF167 domain-containing protein [Kiritimatiellia bacterium]|nr:DUF167 domain-containing protein [Kiritimatiellia bacterium]HRZ12119.1 DUF167 domain-containing protein [Kiritimatiellia bacterium]HSA18123.1 DUF167 domain-containing protein [Kiritimatiellia bacterium]
MTWAQAAPGGARLVLRIVPRADRNAVQGLHGDALKIRLQAPPVDNKANEALVEFLAGRLSLPRHSIRLVAGASGRNKQVLVTGLEPGEIVRRLTG